MKSFSLKKIVVIPDVKKMMTFLNLKGNFIYCTELNT